MLMFRKVLTPALLSSLALGFVGCGESNPAAIPPGEQPKVGTNPTPEKSDKGKPATARKAAVE